MEKDLIFKMPHTVFLFSYYIFLCSVSFEERVFIEYSEIVICLVDVLQFLGKNSIVRLKNPYLA